MEAVRQLALVYGGVILVNLALAGAFWWRYRTALHRSLFLVWGYSVIFTMVQAVPTTNPLALALGFAPVILVTTTLASLLARVVGVSSRARLQWTIFVVALALSLVIYAAGGSFVAMALP